jgi:transposase
MMGHQSDSQKPLFYAFNLEDHVPQGHLLRGIDRFLDLSELRQHLSQFYSHTGRPSIDPELMIRMLIVGYSFGIRSERRLCEEIHLNLAYRWFCRLGLEDPVPDHSSFSKNRHGRFRDSDALRHLFETVLQRCMSEGLVRGEGFAIDASVIKADANRTRGPSGEEVIDWKVPGRSTRAVREYLVALDEDGPPVTTPASISLTDPAARWTSAPGGPAFYAYCTNYLIDLKAGIIVDVEATPATRGAEIGATQTMIERVERRFGLKPDRLVGDTAYGSAETLGWLVEEKHIKPHIPVFDKTEREDGTLGHSAFAYDSEQNRYQCPMGKMLTTTGRVTKDKKFLYRSSPRDCRDCPMKKKCCPNTRFRKIARSIHEAARNVARAIATTAAYARSRKQRKKVEILFAHLKRILKLDRLRLRGPNGAQDEFLLAATAQNLRRMAKWLIPKPPKMVPAPG